MKAPPHPGGGLRHDIEAVGWTVGECAQRLGISCIALVEVLNGKQPITPRIALSLEHLGWGDAGTWLRLQAIHDLAQERRLCSTHMSMALSSSAVESTADLDEPFSLTLAAWCGLGAVYFAPGALLGVSPWWLPLGCAAGVVAAMIHYWRRS